MMNAVYRQVTNSGNFYITQARVDFPLCNYKLGNGVLGDFFLGIGIQTVSKDLEMVEDPVTRVASDLRLMNSNSGAHPYNIPIGPIVFHYPPLSKT